MLKKMRRKAFFVLFFLLLSFLAAEAQELELTVKDAVALALEHNLDFRMVFLDWQQAQQALERAQFVGDREMTAAAEKEWLQADKTYRESRENLANVVRSAYQEILQREREAADRLAAKERAEAQLKIDESKYEAGLLSSLDIQRTKHSLHNAEFSYQTALVNLATNRLQFNELLGLDLGQELLLTESLLLDFLPFDFTLEECFLLALKLDEGVLQAKEGLKKAKEKVLAAQSPFTPLVEQEQALVAEEKAKIHLVKAKNALYFEIRADYYNLEALAHLVQAKEREIELERKTLQAEESKYKAGVISNAQILAQQEKLAAVEQEYSDALLQYSLNRIKLLQNMGRGEILRGEENEN
ncbi:MAG: TolC family protein [Firmicutes bacterium]|nr:TolC family protein [Bacillota bacterium]